MKERECAPIPRNASDSGLNRPPQKVSLSDLYSHLSPEEAAECAARVIGFFRAYCGCGEPDGPIQKHRE